MDGNLTPLQRFFLAFVAFFAVLFNRRFAEEVALVRARTRAGLPPGAAQGGSARTATVNASVRAEPGDGDVSPPVRVVDRGAAQAAPSPAVRADAGGPAVRAESPSARPERSPAGAESKGAGRPVARPVAAAPRAPEHAEALHVLSLLQRDGRLIDFLAENLEGFSDAEIGAAARTVHQGCKKALDAYVELEPVYKDAEGATVTVAAGFDPAAVRLTGNVVGTPPFQGALRHHGWRARKATFPPPQKDPAIIAPAEVEL
ncbi:MAG: DUF2760 domain-containing protein [Anaeromyxobacteraceae bacterium]